MKDAFHCCFCLDTVQHPVIMCDQTHMGCFDCLLEHLRLAENTPLCAMCRSPPNMRFDRFISEIVPTTKKRKRCSRRYEVFLQLLELKKKCKYKTFNRTLKKFAKAVRTDACVEQMSEDISNIVRARVSAVRLKEQRVFDHNLYTNMSI